MPRRLRNAQGLTLVEILVVIAIVGALAAILFSVFAQAKTRGRHADEVNRLRQLYVAVNLYEEEFDRKMPPSIVDLAPNYVPADYLWNRSDARIKGSFANWPANPWANHVGTDRPEVSKRRFPEIVSYAYIGSFEQRFLHWGKTLDFYRNEPSVGMITGLGLMACDSGPAFPGEIDPPGAGCFYPASKYPEIDNGQPASNLAGAIFTVRMDGSIAQRHRPAPTRGSLAFESLFLFGPLKSIGNEIKP